VAILWDPEKAASNVAKHGARFADAAGRILVVVYSWRGNDIRLISARLAEPHEREDYEKP
jgi:uncharacterized DUF497 family protein